jgi:16S rRNA (cytosine1402-N4)-methyltransferase
MDATFGRGGHSRAILEELGPEGRLLAIDRDPQAIAEAPLALKSDPRLELIRGEFAEIRRYAAERNLLGKVAGLLLDLGVSSPQLDEADRGFSFRVDGPLDMRMDPDRGQSAAEWLANVDERTLRNTIQKYGEDRFAGRIARAIVNARKAHPLTSTTDLADVVSRAVPLRDRKRHPATRTFQAIRIFINRELEQLEAALQASIELLAPGGRLCVMSFHSLEDRQVKRFMRRASEEPPQYRGLPDIPSQHLPPMKLIGKAIAATEAEVARNPRARSARLRIAERLA